jgi:hypothetical protein
MLQNFFVVAPITALRVHTKKVLAVYADGTSWSLDLEDLPLEEGVPVQPVQFTVVEVPARPPLELRFTAYCSNPPKGQLPPAKMSLRPLGLALSWCLNPTPKPGA